MFKKLLVLLFFTFTTVLQAQYTTPGTGVHWSLDDLIANAPEAVSLSEGTYTISQDITVAINDTLAIETNVFVEIAPEVLITIAGSFISDAEDISITAVDIEQPYEGFRFEDTSYGYFRNTTINYGGGIRVLTGNFEMDSCSMSYHVSGAATGSAISFSTGSPIVTNSTFTFNDLPALSSGANQEVSAIFTNNYLEANNQSNSNRPQINMGPGGNDTIRIVGNTIIGDPALDMVGGISASSLLGNVNRVIIDNNTVRNNRYGITVLGGNSSGYIRGNILEDNDTQGDPMLGGSGISLNASGEPTMNIIASENQIRRNLWGITVIGSASINLGNTDEEDYNPGNNIFADNGNGGQTYALYNNTALTIYAMNNCWIEGEELTAENVENVISHQVDDNTLGEVIFTPFGCETMSVPDYTYNSPVLYPNPNTGNFTIEVPESATVEIFNISGQKVSQSQLTSGSNNLNVNLASGIYIVKTQMNKKTHNSKLIIE